MRALAADTLLYFEPASGVCRKNKSMNEESTTYRHLRPSKLLILGGAIYLSDRLLEEGWGKRTTRRMFTLSLTLSQKERESKTDYSEVTGGN